MNILDFSNEVLERIVALLDLNDQVELARTNHRLRDVVSNCSAVAKVRHFPDSVLDYFSESGYLVRTLDISNCRNLPPTLREIIKKCPNITKLEAVNTKFSFSDLKYSLVALKKLESLSFSFTTMELTWPLPIRTSRSVRKLYVETFLEPFPLFTLIFFMNRFKALEFVQVDVVGRTESPDLEIMLEELSAERWKTLHTFVCSSHLSRDELKHISVFLRKIFDAKMTSNIEQWINTEKDCYIYEHGYLNESDADLVVDDERVRLLKRCHEVDLTDSSSDQRAVSLRNPWGDPSSLRIKGLFVDSRYPDLNELFTSKLTELDISNCHGNFSDWFWQCLIDSSPSLETMAMSLCGFLLFTEDEARDMGQLRVHNRERLLQKLKLKKLFLKGLEPIPEFYIHSSGFRGQCEKCKQPLNSENLPRLRGLDRLQELTFNNVVLHPSAFEKMANPSAKTIRLTFNHDLPDFRGLRSFVENCRNMRNFKLSGFRGWPLREDELWEALSAGKKLKQLCLGDLYPSSYGISEFQDRIKKFPPSVKFMHFHNLQCAMRSTFLVDVRKVPRKKRRVAEARVIDHSMKESIPGRGLCYSECFAGVVKPIRWTVNEI